MSHLHFENYSSPTLPSSFTISPISPSLPPSTLYNYKTLTHSPSLSLYIYDSLPPSSPSSPDTLPRSCTVHCQTPSLLDVLLYKVKTTDKHLCHIVVLWPVLSRRGRLASSGFLIKRCQTVLVTKETVTVEKKRRRKGLRERKRERVCVCVCIGVTPPQHE